MSAFGGQTQEIVTDWKGFASAGNDLADGHTVAGEGRFVVGET